MINEYPSNQSAHHFPFANVLSLQDIVNGAPSVESVNIALNSGQSIAPSSYLLSISWSQALVTTRHANPGVI